MSDKLSRENRYCTKDVPSPIWKAISTLRTGILPVEVIAVVSLLLLVLMSHSLSVRIYHPDRDALIFAAYHYLGPLLPAIVIPAVVWLYRVTRGQRASFTLRARGLRTGIALGVTVFTHFNLKLWAQLINPMRYDSVYLRLDHDLDSLVTFLEWLGDAFRTVLVHFPHAYHEVFVALFFVSFLVHSESCDSRVFDRLSASVSLVLLLGGLSYAIAPAIGPFIYETGNNPVATAIQAEMFAFNSSFIGSGGMQYEPRFFVASLAAMPSLHFSHSLVFGYFAFRYARLLGWIYLLPITYIACDAVSSKWHYVVDLPAGVAVAAISIALASSLARIQSK